MARDATGPRRGKPVAPPQTGSPKPPAAEADAGNGAKSARRQQREAEILAAAREVFLEKGYEGAAVNEIAARVGVVEGLVFRYFPTKRDLLNEVLRGLYEPLIADVGAGFACITGLRGRLRFIVWRHLRFYTESAAFARLILHEVRTSPGYATSELHALNVRYTDFLRQTLEQAAADGELTPDFDHSLVRSMVYGGIEHLMWPVLYGRRQVDVERMADRITDQILQGLEGGRRATGGSVEARLARLEALVASRPDEAARILWNCRESGTVIEALPTGLRPTDARMAHAVQAALPEVAGRPVVGWKIAATSAAGQAHIQVDGPLPGRILDSFVRPIGSSLSLVGNRMRVVEPEFAFRMGTPLPPRATPYASDEVLAAVASLHPAFELPDSRFADFARAGKAQLIADDACCGRFAFGPAAPAGWRALDLPAHRVQATVTGADGRLRYARDGEGRALLGDPLTALTWLANELSSLGIGLRAGDWASCGTCMVPLQVEPGDRVVADYGTLGRIEIGLSA